MDVIQIGSIPISVRTVTIFLSLGVSFILLWLINKVFIVNIKEPLDWLFQGTMNGIFVWKFSPVLFNPMSIFKQPFSLLYFSGGTKGMILAIFFILFYMGWKALKKRGYSYQILVVISLLWIIGSGLYPSFLKLVGTDNRGTEVFLFLMIMMVVIYIWKKNDFLLIASFYGIASGIVALLYHYSSSPHFIFGAAMASLYLISLSNLNKWKAHLDEEVLVWRT